MKKIVVMMLVVLMVGTVVVGLTGCGDSSKKEKSNEDTMLEIELSEEEIQANEIKKTEQARNEEIANIISTKAELMNSYTEYKVSELEGAIELDSIIFVIPEGIQTVEYKHNVLTLKGKRLNIRVNQEDMSSFDRIRDTVFEYGKYLGKGCEYSREGYSFYPNDSFIKEIELELNGSLAEDEHPYVIQIEWEQIDKPLPPSDEILEYLFRKDLLH